MASSTQFKAINIFTPIWNFLHLIKIFQMILLPETLKMDEEISTDK